ncbi:MAG: hypothetical protein AB8F94_01455 [Saprospiraceae bacterium]
MKNLFVILLLSASFFTTAQINSFSVSVDGSILFSEYAMSRSGNAGTTAGVRFELPIDLPVGQIAISSGLEMSNYGKQYNYNDMRTVGGEDPGFPVIDVTRFDYKYVAIPLRLKYTWRMVYAQVGVKAERFQKQDLVAEGTMSDPAYLEKPLLEIDDIRENNLSTEFALGFNVQMPNRPNVGIYFEPNVNYMTKSIFKNSTLENNQLSYGLRIGAKYTFNNLGKRK